MNIKAFSTLIDELNFLEKEGLIITIVNKIVRVKFQVILILGDNLGLNSILGFIESFSASHYCRICKASKKLCKRMTVEDTTLLRDKDNYASDVALKNEKMTGIRQDCTFNTLNNFHVIENMAVDLMHDFLEGVCVFILTDILQYYIFVKKYFTLYELNTRIASFDFGSENKPQDIQTVHGKNELHIKISAAEMYSLIRFLDVIIGDKIPRSDNHCNLYKYSRQIFDILMSTKVVRGDASILRSLITKLLEKYIELYDELKPKLHFLVHYPKILILLGPIVKFWCMRFESFHQLIKRNANSSNNATNLLKTIAKKQALKLCEMVHNFTYEEGIYKVWKHYKL